MSRPQPATCVPSGLRAERSACCTFIAIASGPGGRAAARADDFVVGLCEFRLIEEAELSFIQHATQAEHESAHAGTQAMRAMRVSRIGDNDVGLRLRLRERRLT